MAKPTFEQLYNQALAFHQVGDMVGLSETLQTAYKAGLPARDLSILGSLVEGTFNRVLVGQAPPEAK